MSQKTITKIDENTISITWTPDPINYPEQEKVWTRDALNIRMAKHVSDRQTIGDQLDLVAADEGFTQTLLDAMDAE